MAAPLVAAEITYRLKLLLLDDDFVTGKEDTAETAISVMSERVWSRMPEDLFQTMLLFLPASSQARMSVVCKRWNKFIKSPAFQELTAFMALSSRSSLCMWQYGEVCCQVLEKRCKVLKFCMDSGLGLNAKCKVFRHAQLLGVAWEVKQETGFVIRCWLLDPANRTWRNLPELVLGSSLEEAGLWAMRLVHVDDKEFEVVLAMETFQMLEREDFIWPQSYYILRMFSCSSTSMGWAVVPIQGFERGAEWPVVPVQGLELGVSGVGRMRSVTITRRGDIYANVGWRFLHFRRLDGNIDSNGDLKSEYLLDRWWFPECLEGWRAIPSHAGVFAYVRGTAMDCIHKLEESTGEWQCVLDISHEVELVHGIFYSLLFRTSTGYKQYYAYEVPGRYQAPPFGCQLCRGQLSVAWSTFISMFAFIGSPAELGM